MRFQSPIVINEANDLRKLAPSVPEPSFALWVAEGGDESNRRLECISIIDADRSFKTTFIGMPDSRVDSNGVGGDELPLPVEAAEAIADSRVGGNGVGGDTEFAIVKIEGAGSLRARFALQREEYVLRGGRIRPKMSFAYLEVMIPLVKTVLAALESTSSAMDFLLLQRKTILVFPESFANLEDRT